MSGSLLKNTKLVNEIKNFHSKNREKLIDIILFGSSMRGKKEPMDVDLLLLFKDREDMDTEYDLRKRLERFEMAFDVTSVTYRGLFESSFLPREAVLTEGYSLVLNRRLSEGFGFDSRMLFLYSLKGFSTSRRMMFHYALKGRMGKKGMLREAGGVKISNTAVMVPVTNSDLFENFLKYWGIAYKKTSLLIPERTLKYGELKL